MLKTNGNVNSRELYANDVGSLVIVAARNFTDRVPYGYVEISQTILFAGVHKPGIARPLAIGNGDKQAEIDAKDREIADLKARMCELASTFSTLTVKSE